MRFQLFAAAALLTISQFAGLAMAQERFRPVGTVTYEPEPAQPEKDVFQIKPEDRRIGAMRILAEDGSAEVRSLRVIYSNGEEETVRVRQTLREGERTNVFELEEVRPIKSVEVTYIPKGNVTLVLLADRRRGEPPPPPPPAPRQWTELACKSVGLLGDRDVVNLNSPERFRALRLRSANYDIEMLEMTVRYGNGGGDRYRIGTVIPAGGRIGPIELRGEARRITQLDLVYRARSIGPVKTRLCIDGLSARPADDEEDDQ
jgi:hypothetical protein